MRLDDMADNTAGGPWKLEDLDEWWSMVNAYLDGHDLTPADDDVHVNIGLNLAAASPTAAPSAASSAAFAAAAAADAAAKVGAAASDGLIGATDIDWLNAMDLRQIGADDLVNEDLAKVGRCRN